MTIFYFFLISYVLLSLSLYKLFEKAKLAPWQALVPGLNFILWNQLVGLPKRSAALLLVPIVNLFIYVGMCVDLVRSFQKYRFRDSVFAVVYAPLYFFMIGLDKRSRYAGPNLTREKAYAKLLAEAREKGQTAKLKRLQAQNPYYKSPFREWTEALVFAVFAAAFIRMLTIEAYAIPTSSMEGSLMVGDHLFVSKMHYGMRTPQTTLMIPLLHNRIPLLNRESYLENPKLPMKRFPALEKLDRNDPFVFNYPEGDSVFVTPGRTWSVHDLRRQAVPKPTATQIQQGKYKLITRPLDKMDHYVKRCVALPGDSLQIIRRQVYINGQAAVNPVELQYRYLVKHETPLNESKFSTWGITKEDQDYLNARGEKHKILILSAEQKEKVQAMSPDIKIIHNDMYWLQLPPAFDRSRLQALGIDDANVRAAQADRLLLTLKKEQVDALRSSESPPLIKPYLEPGRFFPHDAERFPDWTVDDYGPIWIPKAGETVQLTSENIAFYRRIIQIYEGNTLEIKNGAFYINGKQTDQYTFRLNYYWAMGDNRHNSEDSRVWGFVPETHIVGKPLFIFFATKENSIRKGINWRRIFRSASKG